jgi:hypothetical protein
MNAEANTLALLFTVFGVCVLILIAVRAEKRGSRMIPEADRLNQLELKIKYLQDEDIRKGRLISDLQTELAAARERIRFLEGQQVTKPVMAVIEDQPLMVVIGDDPALVVDLVALRGIKGLRVTRLMPADYRSLKATVERFRRQGKPLEFIHFSVHATPEGIQLDRQIKSDELSELLRGVRIAVFMGCRTSEIGDLLPLIGSVVAFREAVPHDEAWQFSLLFWRAIGEGKAAVDAFDLAIERGPTSIGEYAELIEM